MHQREAERLNALSDYEIIDTGHERDFDRITEIASTICGCEISLISFVESDRIWYKSTQGVSLDELPRGYAICENTIRGTDLFMVEDLSKDDRFSNHPDVTDGLKVRFYAGYPIIDPAGFTLGSICVVDSKPKQLDISQQKALSLLAEETLKLVRERKNKIEYENFTTLFEESEDLICIISREGQFKKANPGFTKRLGWNEHDLTSRQSFFELIHPDDHSIASVSFKNFLDGKNFDIIKLRMLDRGGNYRLVAWSTTTDKENQNLFAIGRDIDEETEKNRLLVLSEEKFKVFFENSQGLMCIHDLKGNLSSFNTSGAKVLGYETHELIGRTLFDIVPTERHENLTAYLEEIYKTGHAKGIMLVRKKSGSQAIWLYSNVVHQDANNEYYVIGNAVDITEQQKLEGDLTRTKNLLEETSRLAKIGGWEYKLEEKEIVWTSVTKDIHGVGQDYKPELSTALCFYKDGESRIKITNAVQECIATGQGWNHELVIINSQGKEVWVRAKGHREVSELGQIRIFGTLQDIDEQKRAQIASLKSKKLLEDVLSASTQVSIIATDNNGLITVFNSGSEKLLGYSSQEMVGLKTPAILHDAEEISSLCGNETNEASTIQEFKLFQLCADQKESERPFTYIRKDGQRIRVSLSITSIKDQDGDNIGYLGIATDITEKEQAEIALAKEKATLLAFINNAPAAVAMLDKDMRFLATSRRWMDEYIQNDENLTGRSYYDIFPNLGLERRENHKHVLKGNVVKKDEDIYVDPNTGKPHHISWEMLPWHDFDGSIGGIMIVTQDISIAVKHRDEITAAKLRADFANAAKSDFLANMSHEIRTPLNGVIGFTDLVLKTDLNDTQKQYLSIVNQSATTLLTIINAILDFSKIEAGKFELDIEKCDLFEIASQATDITTYQIQSRNLEMLLNLDTELPRFIWADAMRLKQVLINLLGNASKFTHEGEIELKIERIERVDDQDRFRFGVRDTGIGIPLNKQEKIFNAFAQEDSSTTKKYGGTGLGLTISNKLLNMMGSELQLSSEPGSGSTFFFDISLPTESGSPIEYLGIDMIKSVLVVDDNDNNRTILSKMLSLKSIHTTEAKNGFQALQLFAEGNNYDVILMDYHMPYMDGLETISKLKQSFAELKTKTPIVLLHSSSDDVTLVKGCKELNIDRQLNKPIKINELYGLLSTLNEIPPKSESTIAPIEYSKETLARQYTFLIVEDNEVNRFLARALIEKIHPLSKIIEAENGLIGLDLFKKESPDFIFMDIQMPEMNGYECAKQIRAIEIGHRTPIIALTAANIMREKEKSIEAGMDDFITKPVLEENIDDILKKWLPKIYLHSEDPKEILHFDKNKLNSYLDKDQDKLKRIISITIKQLEQSLSQLEDQEWQNDSLLLETFAHKLYGMSVSAGLVNIANITNELQKSVAMDYERKYVLLRNLKDGIKTIIPILKSQYEMR